jgi:hypothetical protein
MNPIDKASPSSPQAADPDYAPVVGRSLEDKEKLASLEEQASAKTASDYQHIIWAYGILWALFAAYGLFLWRRSARLRADMDALRRAVNERAGGPRA